MTGQKPKPKVITVYSASSSSVSDSYKAHAFELGKLLAQEGWVQLNGGGSVGLMGASTDGALSVGGAVNVVILDKFKGMMHAAVRDVDVLTVDNMPERKAQLYKPADAFVALPGGLGTMEELLEVMSWRQLEFHRKPIVLLNTNGFYDLLWQFLQRTADESFVAKGMMTHAMALIDSPEGVVRYLRDFEARKVDKSTLYSGEMEAAEKHAKQQGV